MGNPTVGLFSKALSFGIGPRILGAADTGLGGKDGEWEDIEGGGVKSW